MKSFKADLAEAESALKLFYAENIYYKRGSVRDMAEVDLTPGQTGRRLTGQGKYSTIQGEDEKKDNCPAVRGREI